MGEVTRADVLRATVIVETARRTLVESENVLEFARNTLRNILNFAPDAPLRFGGAAGFSRHAAAASTELLARAYAQREDLRVKELAIDQDIARAQSRSSASTGRASSRSSTRRAITSPVRPLRAITTGRPRWRVQVPIFTGGQREIDLMTAEPPDRADPTRPGTPRQRRSSPR